MNFFNIKTVPNMRLFTYLMMFLSHWWEIGFEITVNYFYIFNSCKVPLPGHEYESLTLLQLLGPINGTISANYLDLSNIGRDPIAGTRTRNLYNYYNKWFPIHCTLGLSQYFGYLNDPHATESDCPNKN